MGRAIARQNKHSKTPDSIGFITKNSQIQIVNLTTGENLGPNQVGEIWIHSSLRMLGYYKDLEATKQAIDDEGRL